MNLFPMSTVASEWASERTNERSAEQANEWAMQANEQMDMQGGPVLTSRFLADLNHSGEEEEEEEEEEEKTTQTVLNPAPVTVSSFLKYSLKHQ